jgi:hypothetical protein
VTDVPPCVLSSLVTGAFEVKIEFSFPALTAAYPTNVSGQAKPNSSSKIKPMLPSTNEDHISGRIE